MLVLAVTGAIIEMVNVLNLIAPLILLSGVGLAAFSQAQLAALAAGFLELRGSGVFVAQVFWGLWLLPFGILVMKASFLPKALGALLVIACFGYVTSSVTFLVAPAHLAAVSPFTMAFGGLGEGLMMLWLLVMGVKAPVSQTPPPS